ncbi:hypothetical protein HBH91_062120 [Parastagonospora nodorum]|nr:hypothetical protein HBH91_062120 [Parastagonospora nodorum]
MSNRSIALITNKFSVALLTKLAILNNANVTLVDAVIDALMITLIKNDDDLLGTVNSYIKPPLKRCKTEAADSRHAKASRRRTKKDKDLEDSNTSSDRLGKEAQLKKTRDKEELAKAKKEKEEKENEGQSLCKSRDGNKTLHSRRLTDAYILYFKELLSNNSGIFANAISIGKTQAIVLAVLIEHFCFFSNSPLENISRLTKEEVIEMRIDTTNAISKALATANKLFVIVCSFRKVDKHVFRAYNTISVTAQRTIIRKGSPYIEKRAILLPRLNKILIFVSLALISLQNRKGRDSVTGNCIYKIEDAQQCRDILEKEGLNELEASRRVIFNCFKISCKVKRFTLNSVKDLFTNLSKDYFLIIVALIAFAEVIILTEATHVVIIEPQDSIIYFNLDSKLELKVLGKQDVKITS